MNKKGTDKNKHDEIQACFQILRDRPIKFEARAELKGNDWETGC